MESVKEYLSSLTDSELRPTALRVALVVGSILFSINHGWALTQGQMSRDRWVAASMTYIVPYMVNVHGQYISRTRRQKPVTSLKT
ncbi:nitrate/nitrite transporter NrtS [Microcoleus sp. FACHB-672]|uniref:nitrate/nitrite transporter NrtS n=1 Tax=Microcoleus sp. FACHB-672 TaxID=2692825 RepID=UPI00168A3750|nr:nitrate/nitrite transporter NrtS [Microcoleus sp. FACHB-672]MBD2042603.1 nitrate/nitrite transporter NrtS [Microcoleus sp. FACHB-672]